jgi:hypothetical protein
VQRDRTFSVEVLEHMKPLECVPLVDVNDRREKLRIAARSCAGDRNVAKRVRMPRAAAMPTVRISSLRNRPSATASKNQRALSSELDHTPVRVERQQLPQI